MLTPGNTARSAASTLRSSRKLVRRDFRLHVPGVHNVLNATAAIAVGIGSCNINEEHIRWHSKTSVRHRRFQLRGTAAGVSVIDDYGHHPTEVRATLAAARQCGFCKIHVVSSRIALHPHTSCRWTSSSMHFTMPTP